MSLSIGVERAHLDLSTGKALSEIYKVEGSLPALVINGTTYNGYQSLEQLNSYIANK